MTRFGARAVMLNSWPTKHRLERMAEIMDPQGRGSMDERIHKGILRLIALAYQHMISTEVVRCFEPGQDCSNAPIPIYTPTTPQRLIITGPDGNVMGRKGGMAPAGASVKLYRPQLLAQRAFPLGRGREEADADGPKGHPNGCGAVIVWACCGSWGGNVCSSAKRSFWRVYTLTYTHMKPFLICHGHAWVHKMN